MFSMQQHHMYGYSAPVPASMMQAAAPVATAPTRQYANHSNSSAFSSSANPDEDWTKISDLAERRRIQNRIAQRNYRKKLKRRLEDLERRASSSDGKSPSPSGSSGSNGSTGCKTTSASRGNSTGSSGKTHRPKKQQPTLSSLSAAEAAHQQRQQQQQQQQQQQRRTSPFQQQEHLHPVMIPHPKQAVAQSQFTPPLNHDDDLLFAPTTYDDRSRSHTPPNMFSSYPTYPAPPEDMLVGSAHSTASSAQSYRTDTASAYGYDWTLSPDVPVTLPSMGHHSHHGHHQFGGSHIKREVGVDEDAVAVAAAVAATTMPPYMSYHFMPTAGMDTANPFDSNPHTPPLSHSYDHSTSCSDADYEYPTTPLSMASPGVAA